MAMKGKAGFTIVEGLIAAAVTGMLITAATGVFMGVMRFHRQASARAEVQRDSRVGLELIQREVAQARGHTIVIDRFDAAQPPYSRITFSTFDGRTLTFYQKGTRLLLKTIKGTAIFTAPIASNLREVIFSYPRSDAPDLVAVSMTFEKTTYQGNQKSLELGLANIRIENGDAY
jgi:type II secretory pathway pseudopilin PulG